MESKAGTNAQSRSGSRQKSTLRVRVQVQGIRVSQCRITGESQGQGEVSGVRVRVMARVRVRVMARVRVRGKR